ncbi:MAG: enoyl-CoA hydratase/isomerase family protein [Deltaproteobacteria bacterium]|nr:enoyl-CoA hydratase/isomerase family protein [Deltaproteobacteria bacterium]
MENTIKVETTDGIATITLNRPPFMNAFHREMTETLGKILFELSADPKVFGVIITGAGKAFCAGGDLKWLSDCGGKSPGESFRLLATIFHQAILEIRRMPKPVVAAINGFAAGGGFSLALSCDFRIMEASAVLRQAYTSNGLSIDGGGSFSLPRLVGLARSIEIAALDQPISSEKALSWGLVTKVAEDGKASQQAFEFIEEVLKRPLSSFSASKKLLTDSFGTSLEVQLEREKEFISFCADHPNGREGVSAFLQKRLPRFTKTP